jgi:hypothetical protein
MSLPTKGWVVEMTDSKGTKILARSLYNQLREGGLTQNQIIDLSSELLELVASDIRNFDESEDNENMEIRQSA